MECPVPGEAAQPSSGARSGAEAVFPFPQSCWNCGRKASETCSGCNTARYCGSFCQHKDWEKHHHVCGQTLQGLPGPAAPGPGQPDGVPAMASSPSEAGSVAASRAGTPATPAPLDSASR
ncbi:hypothetical protein DV515_00013792 [Chloebia gouldiae]|uniref:MYND-type domain-containing protein n=1 Tax=Chloebia gouldiae TaxID=44316 RepID=A0A3L8S1B0_CHLGU|nr:hypothetical protein DV515_00013792 [Chloebia gouldiae]